MTHPYATLARSAIEAWSAGRPFTPQLPDALERSAPVFVSLHSPDGALRGCIGHVVTDEPRISREIAAMAVAAASDDPRFAPLRPEELPDLQVEVSVLGPPESVSDLTELDPRRYGVVVSDGWRRGVLLPDLEGVDTVEQQLSIARRKAGIPAGTKLRVERFVVEKHR